MRGVWRWLLVLVLGGTVMGKEYLYANYTEDVLSGKIVACRWVKLAVRRHLDDLGRADTPGFPYHFDTAAAERAIDFIQSLSHTKGEWALTGPKKSNLIRLEAWEQFIVAQIHGWRRSDGNRRFTHAYIEVARKNGKTTLGAGLGNYAFFADRPQEAGPEVYFAATKQEQAAIAWREAKAQIVKCPALARRAKVYVSKQVIVRPDDEAARMRPLGRDSDTEDGLNPSFALIDEYHAHPDASLLNVIASGMGSRSQPLIFIITTAGFDKAGPCFTVEHENAEKILEGSLTPRIENFFAIIFTIDAGDEWTDPAVWVKANPNLDVSVKPEFIAERVKEALASPAKQNRPDSTQPEKLYTEAEALAATQAALDKAIPLAVQAAVAQKEGEVAAANAIAEWNRAEARRQTVQTSLWRTVALSGGLGLIGSLLDRPSMTGAGFGAMIGCGSGIFWGLAEAMFPNSKQ